jgi:DNA adenine methylase
MNGPVKHPMLRYHGGKWRIAPWIISYIPTHKIYVELFGGGGSILLRKPRSYAELYNDFDEEIEYCDRKSHIKEAIHER